MNNVSAVHYTDIYPRSFEDFRKKYLKLAKQKASLRDYYVQFTDHGSDVLMKEPHKDPNHRDPVGVYGYPLAYVLKHPADIWYGSRGKFLRVLKSKKEVKVLLVQYVDNNDARNYLYKMGISSDVLDKAKLLWPDRVGKSDAKAFFTAVQMDLTDVVVPRSKQQRKEVANQVKVRTGLEQTALLRKAGFDVVEDTATKGAKAVINDREPEQIIFLHRGAFDVVEVIQLRTKDDDTVGQVGTAQDPKATAPKLAGLIADRLGDKIIQRDNILSYNKLRFWTKAGREIIIDFQRPQSYYEDKKMGEKRHKESKLATSYLVKVSLESERSLNGGGPILYNGQDPFEEIADTIAYQFKLATPVEGFKPLSLAVRQEEDKARSIAYTNKEEQKKAERRVLEIPQYIKHIKGVATELGFPLHHVDSWDTNDATRSHLEYVLYIVGRKLTNEKLRIQNEFPKNVTPPVSYNAFFDKFNKEEHLEAALSSAEEVIDYMDPVAFKELAELYKVALDWMFEHKTWNYQHPVGFFDNLLEDIRRSKEEKNNTSAASVLLLEAVALLR